MFVVAGLGNPGPKYAATRHNVGFLVADELARRSGASSFRDKFSGLQVRVSVGDEDVCLLKPQTFMNRSGESVQKAIAFFRVPLDRLVVVHDEIDLPFGTIRVKVGGGAAGHNGLKSILQCCGGPEFTRVRFGVGRHPTMDGADWVLSPFGSAEVAELPGLTAIAADAAEAVVREGAAAAMNRFNVRAADQEPER